MQVLRSEVNFLFPKMFKPVSVTEDALVMDDVPTSGPKALQPLNMQTMLFAFGVLLPSFQSATGCITPLMSPSPLSPVYLTLRLPTPYLFSNTSMFPFATATLWSIKGQLFGLTASFSKEYVFFPMG